jgi:hypothetical protein
MRHAKNNIMKKIILFLLFSINLISAQGTDIDSLISNQIKHLTENKISEFFIVEKFCIGCIANESDCDYGNTYLYVFWKDKNESYFRKLDKCNSPQTRISDEIINNYILNINKIEKESVKDYQIGKDDYAIVDHSTVSKFYFRFNGNIIIKEFDYYNLTTENLSPNINYEYNNSLELIKLSKACDKVISKKQ